MIANLKYGNGITGIVNYVYKKVEQKQGTVIGSSLLDNPSKKELICYLKYQGELRGHKDPYSHFSISLSHDDAKVSDAFFNNIANDFMDKMGYHNQPFVVVRHTDTKHQHIHIISTTVNEEGKKIYLYADRIRAKNICRLLEKKYNLKKVSNIKEKTNPRKRKEHQELSSKFIIGNTLDEVFMKYKPRSIDELSLLLKNHNIKISSTKKHKKNGVLFHQLNESSKSLIKPIPGSHLNPNYSYNKLQSLFETNSKNNQLYLHKNRLKKQIRTEFELFKNINISDINAIFSKHKITFEEIKNENAKTLGFRIFDKSGYIFKASEVDRNFTLHKSFSSINYDDSKSTLDLESKAFENSIRRIYKESYLAIKKEKIANYVYESNLINTLSLNEIHLSLKESKEYKNLEKFLTNTKGYKSKMNTLLKEEFINHKDTIPSLKIKEKALIVSKIELVKNITEKLSNVSEHFIFQSLGLDIIKKGRGYVVQHLLDATYQVDYNTQINTKNSEKPLQKYNGAKSRYLNQKVLFHLFDDTKKDEKKYNKFIESLGKNTLYLNLFYSEIYDKLESSQQIKLDVIKNETYTKESMKEAFKEITDARDFVKILNYRGIEIIKSDTGVLTASSVFTQNNSAIVLEKKYKDLLEKHYDINTIIETQNSILEKIGSTDSENNLTQFWVADLIRNEEYLKAAYLMVHDKERPFIDPEELSEHMENGLRMAIENIQEEKSNKELLNLLKMISYLLDNDTHNDVSPNSYFVDELSKKKKKKKKGFKIIN